MSWAVNQIEKVAEYLEPGENAVVAGKLLSGHVSRESLGAFLSALSEEDLAEFQRQLDGAGANALAVLVG